MPNPQSNNPSPSNRYDADTVRSRARIEDIVEEFYPLKKEGRCYISKEHDSLVINPDRQWYHWNSRGEKGDVFDFVGRHVLNVVGFDSRRAADFMEALEWVAKRLNVDPTDSLPVKVGKSTPIELPPPTFDGLPDHFSLYKVNEWKRADPKR